MSTATATTETTDQKLSNAAKIAPGTKWSRSSYGVVTSVQGKSIHVKNDQDFEWSVGRDIFEQEFLTPDQFQGQVKVTRTELAQIIAEHPRMVMTVCFIKQLDANGIADALQNATAGLDGDDLRELISNNRKWRKMLRETANDSEREMVGYHTNSRDEGGRFWFTDMEAPKNNQLRRVDPRTLQWAIINNTKYVVK